MLFGPLRRKWKWSPRSRICVWWTISCAGNSALRRRNELKRLKFTEIKGQKETSRGAPRRDELAEVHPNCISSPVLLWELTKRTSCSREASFADTEPSQSSYSEDEHVQEISLAKRIKLNKWPVPFGPQTSAQKTKIITEIAHLPSEIPLWDEEIGATKTNPNEISRAAYGETDSQRSIQKCCVSFPALHREWTTKKTNEKRSSPMPILPGAAALKMDMFD